MPKKSNPQDAEEPPKLVPPCIYNQREKLDTYRAVDYLNVRFHAGDHVVINADNQVEWVGLIESIFMCPEMRAPAFRCRWFWSMQDVKNHAQHHHMNKGSADSIRASKHEACELLQSDTCDVNRVDTIVRKCTILSWNNFNRVKKQAIRKQGPWAGIYFCERLYKDKDNVIFELNNILFPGDPTPPKLLEEIGYGPKDVEKVRDRRGVPPYLVSIGPSGMQKNDRQKHENPSANINRTPQDDDGLNPHAVYII